MSTSATYRLAVKWVDDTMLTAVNRKRAFGRWYAARNEHLPTEAWEGLQPAWDAFMRETGGDSNWTKPVPQEVVDGTGTKSKAEIQAKVDELHARCRSGKLKSTGVVVVTSEIRALEWVLGILDTATDEEHVL